MKDTRVNTVEKYQIADNKGCICISLEGYQHIDIDDTLEILDQIAQYRKLGRENIRLMLDITHAISIDSEARTLLASKKKNTCLEAMALVATTPISKLIAGFISSNIYRDMPISHFEHKEAAIDWLSKRMYT